MGTQRGVRGHLPCGKLVWGFYCFRLGVIQASWHRILGWLAGDKIRGTGHKIFVFQRKEEAQETELGRETFSGNMRSGEPRRYYSWFPNPHSHMIFAIFNYSLCTTIDLKLSLNWIIFQHINWFLFKWNFIPHSKWKSSNTFHDRMWP